MYDKDNLPPFRKAVKIRFWSLRLALDLNYGVFEAAVKVVRWCYRRKDKDDPNGWLWVMRGFKRTYPKHLAEEDQISLDVGSELEIEYV